MAETHLGGSIPSFSGSVVLDLGPGTGALVLHTPPELDSMEIEISRIACGAPRRRTHSRVRQRHTPGGVQYAAVYPGLAAGDYAVWRDASTSAMIVTVAGGQVTTARWPGSSPCASDKSPTASDNSPTASDNSPTASDNSPTASDNSPTASDNSCAGRRDMRRSAGYLQLACSF